MLFDKFRPHQFINVINNSIFSHYGNTGQKSQECVLTLDASSSTQLMAESSTAPPPPPPPHSDETGSYLQVVVEKHRRKRAYAPAAGPAPRLPAASSPLPAGQGTNACPAGGGGGSVYVVQPPMLLACATGASLCPALAYYQRHGTGEAGEACGPAGAGAPRASLAPGKGDGQAACPPPAIRHEPDKKSKSWKLFGDVGVDDSCDDGPECVEVYYFERGSGEFLATRAAARPTACERAGSRAARPATALLAELLAAPRLLVALPVALLLHVERCALMSVRHAVTGAVQTASDYLLKPALALAFNAVCAPLLVCCGQTARGVRDALTPLAQTLDALAEPPARLLRALRLVEVRLHCPHRDSAPP